MNLTWCVYCSCLLSAAAGVQMLSRRSSISLRFQETRMLGLRLKSSVEGLGSFGGIDERRGTLRWRIKEIIQKGRRMRIDEEIYEAVSFLRNLTSLRDGSCGGTDFILEQLSGQRGLLRSTYLKMLGYLRMNQKEEAMRIFAQRSGTEAGADFARLLLQWDEIRPEELSEALLSHQKSIKEMRLTAVKKRDELVSDLIYLPVVINVLAVLINFIYIAYFMEQQEMIEEFMVRGLP